MNKFKLKSSFKPTGDQPTAISKLVGGFLSGNKRETLLGVTGSGKTFTMANIIEKLNVPTLVIAHNKTLAAQLYSEFKDFFPDNAVEYFVSYYDYYQPEAYVPQTDTYIDKDASINDEIDKLRHSATASLCERNDVIIVSSVSCIYGLGSPIDYKNMTLSLRPNDTKSREDIIKRLVEIQYHRNEIDFKRGTFRVKGDTIDIYPVSFDKEVYRIKLDFDTIEKIQKFDLITGEVVAEMKHIVIFPATQYAVDKEKIMEACDDIVADLKIEVEDFKKKNKLIEAQRLEERTNYDVEMLRETGFCSGIENYERYLNFQEPGVPPYTLIDYFPKDFLIIVDESHKTLPQIGGMYNGNLSRKTTLVNYGFRLKSALDNRPLNFTEFESKINKILYVSATPNEYEKEHEELRAEQLIRPTGLLDPIIEVRPTKNQIDDLIIEINKEIKNKNKVLITTLTKRMAEDLTKYLLKESIRVRYLHSDVETLERAEIIRDMRLDKFDVLVGINLLREGLDIPEISLVVILDADKEGFLRSEISLIQTVGRAARNENGRVIMYADNITDSMKNCIEETERRRKIQNEYNIENNITPKTIKKRVQDLITISKSTAEIENGITKDYESMSKKELDKVINELTKLMREMALELNFEQAAIYRDRINEIKKYAK
ncbi:MAG: excinuclease ABC subunit UvrB [Lachnospiraceae bacterium]|nr:excinuclease ABC subunit UvrB [Lachnospiraceae bacterium]